jgi:translation elongation factor EF-G
VFNFLENNETLNPGGKAISKLKKTLNLLYRIFHAKTGEIDKPGWIITLYLFVAHLSRSYSITKLRKEIGSFYIDFYQNIIDAPNTRNVIFNRFYEAISKSTTSKKNIQYRLDVILNRFVKEYHPQKLDENRLFSRKQKLEIFRRDSGRCTHTHCKKKLIFGDPKTHYHHSEKHVEGGVTDISNGRLVCRKCHLTKIHSIK